MSAAGVACPRCGQDWLVRVRLVRLGKSAILCPECDALWFSEKPESDNFVDYGTFMRAHGCTEPEDSSEIEFGDALVRTP
jgi:hypothetical protein